MHFYGWFPPYSLLQIHIQIGHLDGVFLTEKMKQVKTLIKRSLLIGVDGFQVR
jgi:hypothetical protein